MNNIRSLFLFGLVLSLVVSCKPKPSEEEKNAKLQQQAETYLSAYNTELQKLYTTSAETSWTLNTRIVDGDTVTQKAYEEANEKFSSFLGSQANIDSAKKYLGLKDQLTSLQERQFNAILYAAGGSPETAKDAVVELIKVSGDQTKVLYGFDFKIDKKSVTKNDISNILTSDAMPPAKLKAWTASKEVGKVLKPGLEKLRALRNTTVQGLGYSDFFSYQVSDYGMTREEMLTMTEGFIKDVWPLYRELHTWARYELAKKYKQPVPEYLPAHWLPNQWGQQWDDLIKVEGINIDDTLKKKNAEWIVRKGEEFYQSLGFTALPSSFYEKSSLYPLPANATYKKNNHASAWHIDLDKDVRSLMSVENNSEWWSTSLHELGHIYYYISYSRPEIPYTLRGGANRAYHEAIGSQIGLASLQKPLLQSVGLIPANVTSNDTLKMLSEALEHIPLVPWGAGVMTRFEDQLYAANLPPEQFNKTWWELVKKYQGIVPPADRGEEFCDACTKTHIIDDPAQYYDYSMAEVLLFQFHDHIAKNILKQDPHATNYWGSKEVGSFLKKMMETGATIDWREHLKANLGTEVSAKPMVDYFAVLMEWLKKQNKGRKYTLPEQL
ncbi:MAG: M2 family metallopeptidase [Chryseolinea sp.]